MSPHSRPTSCLCLSFISSSATLNTAVYASCFSCNNRSSLVVFKNKHYHKAQQKSRVHKFIYYFSWSFVKSWSTKNCRSVQVHIIYRVLIFVWWVIYEKTSNFRSITYNMIQDIQVKTQQIYYGVQGQVNNNMFRPFYSSAAIIRSSKVTSRGIHKVIECLLLHSITMWIPLEVTLLDLMMAALE